MHPGTQPLGVYLHEGSYATRSAYILEILAHAGVPFTRVDAATLPDALQSLKIIILPHHGVTTPEMGRLYGFVAAGGALIGLGGTSGLDDLFGVRTQTGAHEAFLQVTQPNHPLVRDLHSSLHVWDAVTARAAGATVLGQSLRCRAEAHWRRCERLPTPTGVERLLRSGFALVHPAPVAGKARAA